jgi:hypothetical protein
MKRFLCFLLLLAIPLGPCAAAGPSSEVCDPSQLPEPVRQVLDSQFPTWRYETLEDFNGYYRDLWMKSAPVTCPGMIKGSFDHTSRISYAFLLMPRAGNSSSYKLVVVSESEGKKYHAASIASFESPSHFPAISKVKPGKYSDSQKTKTITISTEGILLEELEVGATLYYELGGKYRKLLVSE